MEIRPGTVEDAAAVALVHVRSWQGAYRGLVPQGFLDRLDDSLDRRTEWWAGQVAADVVYMVGENDAGDVVGFSSAGKAREDHTAGELYTIYLHPEAWGSGLAAKLLAVTVGGLVERHYAEALLWVLDTNGRARRFYEKHGWRADGGAKIEVWGDISLSEVRYRTRL